MKDGYWGQADLAADEELTMATKKLPTTMAMALVERIVMVVVGG